MKLIHYRNIGYPKTGTNWLWLQLMNNKRVDARFAINYKEYKGRNLEHYKKLYEKYNVSVNLNTHTFCELKNDDHFEHPNNIGNHTTHITFIFRNFYEVLNSMFNMEKNRNQQFRLSQNEFKTSRVPYYFDIEKIFNYWKSCNIKFLFYDDLKKDPKQFYHDICDYIGIDRDYKSDIGIKFSTNVTEQLNFIDVDVIKYMNDNISKLEDLSKRKLSHWKKII